MKYIQIKSLINYWVQTIEYDSIVADNNQIIPW